MRAFAAIFILPLAVATHYEDPKNGCGSDEQAVRIQGVKGDFCSPKCKGTTCPTDPPSASDAKPQCALKTTTGAKYCALLCTPGSNAACPTGATCQPIQGVGICTYPAASQATAETTLTLGGIEDELVLPPNMQSLVDLARESPERVLEHIKQSPLRAVVKEVSMPSAADNAGAALPTVTGHGMGDSCFEPGFFSVTRGIAKRTGTYAICIPTGNNIISDTIDGYLMSMDKSVDIFAAKIRADKKLAGGFNAIGFSQGNSLIRGYIQKYNDPPVNAFISVHGTVMGVGAFPSCFDQGKPLGLLCKAFAEVLGDLAYSKLVQGILFQAGYYRDPKKVGSQAYLTNSQIGQWNNENSATANSTYTANFGKVKAFAMVKALKDSMVYPNEGEHWGSLPDGTYGQPLDMKDTKFFKDDLFGLKAADAANKISYETTAGDHLQFSDEELYGWVDKYFLGKASDSKDVVV